MLSIRMSCVAVGLLFLMGSAELARADVIVMRVPSIEGDNETAGREGTIPVLGFTMGVDTQRDQEGRLLGRRVYRPLTIEKLIDQTTPALFEALLRNERLEVQFLFFCSDREDGREVHYYTITLFDANIANISQTRPNDPAVHRSEETISFVFQALSVRFEETQREAMGITEVPPFMTDFAP